MLKDKAKRLKIGNILSKKDFSDDELAKILPDVELKELIKAFIVHLKTEHKLDAGQICALFGKTMPKKDLLPISIFDNSELGCLEAVVKYLKDEFNLRFREIAVMLNRNERTIWATYNVACKKRKEKLPAKDSKFFIPVSAFTDRKFSVLEAIVSYLKEKFNLRYSKIAMLLNRDERNIWTAYNNYKKKNE